MLKKMFVICINFTVKSVIPLMENPFVFKA